MTNYKEESAKRSGTTVKLSNTVVCHFCPTLRAQRFSPPALSKPLSVVPTTACGLFLAEASAKIASVT